MRDYAEEYPPHQFHDFKFRVPEEESLQEFNSQLPLGAQYQKAAFCRSNPDSSTQSPKPAGPAILYSSVNY